MNGCNDDSSWEDIYDSGQLDEQLENFDTDQLEPLVIRREEQAEQSTVGILNNEKQIKILKRSETNSEGDVERCHPENRHLIEKSVAQREKDYAAARERIMGTKSSTKTSDYRRRDKNQRRGNNGNSRQPG